MSYLQEKQLDWNGLRVHTISTEKYKTNTIVLLLKNNLSEDTVTKRALLPQILQSGTAISPTRKELRNRLDDLYGATLSVDVQKKGENHIIVLRMDVANESYLQDPLPVLEKGMELLAEVLLKPALEENAFVSSIVESEKRSLKQRIQSVHDDKMRYANMRVTEEMCKGEPFALSVYGKEDEIERLNSQELFSYYKQVLENDEIDIYVVGDVKAEQVEEMTKKYFQMEERKPISKGSNSPGKKEISEENVVFEEQDVKQGKLHIGYRTNVTFADEDYYALQVFNGLFGGFSHSKLFINVREKASLAYYAASRYESHKGIIMVMSGIEFENYEKAVTIIKEQMQHMQNGDFTEKEVAQTKAMISNQLLETLDVPRASIELLYHNVIANTNRTMDDWLTGIEKVSKEDIVRVANKIQLDTTYFLKGKGAK